MVIDVDSFGFGFKAGRWSALRPRAVFQYGESSA
jgi:hypothetical protein